MNKQSAAPSTGNRLKKLRAMRVLMTITTVAGELHAELLLRRVPSRDQLNRWMSELERAGSAGAKLVDSLSTECDPTLGRSPA